MFFDPCSVKPRMATWAVRQDTGAHRWWGAVCCWVGFRIAWGFLDWYGRTLST